MDLSSEAVGSHQLGALGLIGSVIRELGIIEKIDARLPLNESKGGVVSYGQRVAAMILNGLGFMNSRLYMTPHYFADKPVAQLLDADITADQLNDDCLGRGLDKLAGYGVTQLFSELAFEIASEKGLLGKRFHLDSTSFVLYGDYENATESPIPAHGYSKAHRPDLKQVMLSLTQGGVANLPLWMEALDGNSSDKRSFHETVQRVKQFANKLDNAPDDICFVVDAAFYDIEQLKLLDTVNWITRVPATLTECKSWLHSVDETLHWEKVDEQYQTTEKTLTVNGLEQRWVMVKSMPAYQRELNTLNRRLSKAYESLTKSLWHLSHQVFGCEEDANVAMKSILKKEKYHTVDFQVIPIKKYIGRGRPTKDTPQQVSGYRVEYIISTSLDKLEKIKQRLGRFVLGTNQLDTNNLSAKEVLKQYKEQSQVESGFKFIKDNAFELSSFFLKTPARIGALMMVMTLCLMVYNFAQYHIRQCLEDNDDALPNQLGKPVKNPTMKWIAELMQAIAVVTIHQNNIKHRFVTNVNAIHKRIIAYFGPTALHIYGLPPDFYLQKIDYHNYKKIRDWCEM